MTAFLAVQGVCSLGIHSDNAVARHPYLVVGYTSPVAWAGRLVRPPG